MFHVQHAKAAQDVAGCTGKERFADPALARKAARRKKGRRIYRCPSCSGWHVGTWLK